uniref:Uncharacterized protein n=1 Tax=Anguilla anguilla TaxID=7936 RepID=A0A0E9XRD5_ANGAN
MFSIRCNILLNPCSFGPCPKLRTCLLLSIQVVKLA